MSRHLVDPELLGILPMLDGVPPVTPETLPALREAIGRFLPPYEPRADVVREERFAPGMEGAPDVRLLVYRPADAGDAPLPAILHMHGGGFFLGSPDMGAASHGAIAARHRCVVVSVDYRLTPETRFPGNAQDCWAALGWLHEQAAALGVDRTRIGVMGESAGGALSAVLTLMARDRGERMPAFQILIMPVLDDRTCVSADPHPHAGQVGWSIAQNLVAWRMLLGHEPGGEGVSPFAAPARAADLSGLPPAFIAIGALDQFLEESMDYARRLSRAGVPIELHVYPGAFHGFQLAARARVTVRAEADLHAALGRFLNG